jgi:hypothetical protein
MKITRDISLISFEAWGPARDTLDTVIDNGADITLEAILEDLYPDGIDGVQLNDILAYESDWIFEVLGINEEEEEEEEADAEALQEKPDKKYNLYYQNYETKTGTPKEFEKVTEVLSLDDVKPISGTLKDIEKFIPKLIKTSGRDGIYYIHQCLIIVDAEDCFIEDFIYKTIDIERVI